MAALAFGIAETVAAFLVLIPRFRRWGAGLIAILLIGFVGYFAFNYDTLRGAECSCFPWIKRVVGPEFFMVDGAMLVLAFLAGTWSKPARGLGTAFAILGITALFGLGSYRMDVARQTGTKSPDAVRVNGQPYSIRHGKVLLFFFNPGCEHCDNVAKTMSRFNWGATRVVGVPVGLPEDAPRFLEDTGLKAVLTSDFPSLKTTFGYTTYPFAVAVENGRERAAIAQFDNDQLSSTLRTMGFIL